MISYKNVLPPNIYHVKYFQQINLHLTYHFCYSIFSIGRNDCGVWNCKGETLSSNGPPLRRQRLCSHFVFFLLPCSANDLNHHITERYIVHNHLSRAFGPGSWDLFLHYLKMGVCCFFPCNIPSQRHLVEENYFTSVTVLSFTVCVAKWLTLVSFCKTPSNNATN